MSQLALELKNVSVHFGGIKAVSELSFGLKQGEILALIGPNGAGKTTAFNAITGVYQPTFGEVQANGKTLVGKRPYQVTECGLARTFQNIRLFKECSVRENVLIAMDRSSTNAFIPEYCNALFRPARFWKAEAEKRDKVEDLLKIFDLHNISEDIEAKNLPYGVQRRL
jgi:branched-chain amino acid transport system ATP-binding protein